MTTKPLSLSNKLGCTYVLADGSLVEQRDGPGGQALLGFALGDVPELLRVLLDTHGGHKRCTRHVGTLNIYLFIFIKKKMFKLGCNTTVQHFKVKRENQCWETAYFYILL